MDGWSYTKQISHLYFGPDFFVGFTCLSLWGEVHLFTVYRPFSQVVLTGHSYLSELLIPYKPQSSCRSSGTALLLLCVQVKDWRRLGSSPQGGAFRPWWSQHHLSDYLQRFFFFFTFIYSATVVTIIPVDYLFRVSTYLHWGCADEWYHRDINHFNPLTS